MLASILNTTYFSCKKLSSGSIKSDKLSMLNFKGVDKTPDSDVFESYAHKKIQEEKIKKEKEREQAIKHYGKYNVTELNNLYSIAQNGDDFEKMYQIKQALYNIFPKRIKAIESKKLGVIDTPMIAQRFLKEDESKAISEYLHYYPHNAKLRQGLYDDEELPEAIQHIDNVIDKSDRLKEDAIVYRAVAAYDEDSLDFIRSIKKGNTIKDKSFVSVAKTVDTQFKCFLNRPNSVALRIKLPKGTKGLNINFSEFLLPRNSQIKVVAYDEKYAIADCEYILPERV